MDSIFLRSSTQRLNLKEGQLILSENDVVIEKYPIRAVEGVFVYGNAQITTQALKECLKEGVRVNYFTVYGKYLGRLEPGFPKNTMRRLFQYRIYWDDKLRLEWARSIIAAKIQGELVELRRLQEQNISFPAKKIKQDLRHWYELAAKAENLKILLGIEGMAARCYYQVFPFALPKEVLWKGRSYHPARDTVNEILSAVYGVAAQTLREKIEANFLDPHCSFLHEPGYGRGGLTYDLLEIFRAVSCDHIALRMIRRDPEIRAAAALGQPGNLTNPLRDRLCRKFREELHKCKAKQKSTLDQQMTKICRMTAAGMCPDSTVPCLQSILPER